MSSSTSFRGANQVIEFWFTELSPADWYRNSAELDAVCRTRFLDLHQSAAVAELAPWRESAQGRLAEIIVLDQLSRNIFRGTAAAFATDNLALVLAQEAVAQGCLEELPINQAAFILMPYMHSESRLIHEQAVTLFDRPGMEHNLDFENKHKVIIDRFGRYPHRNVILGRTSTNDELDFLKTDGSSF